MAFEKPIVVYDACVLYPFHLRNLLVELAIARLVEAHWSERIQDEWVRNLSRDRPALNVERLRFTQALMEAALPSAKVTGFERYIAGLVLSDADDRHVVAAGIACGASTILTWNLGDFPAHVLSPHGLVARNPDDFLRTLAAERPMEMIATVARSRAHLTISAPSAMEFAAVLERQGLVHFSAWLRSAF